MPRQQARDYSTPKTTWLVTRNMQRLRRALLYQNKLNMGRAQTPMRDESQREFGLRPLI
jgi:hypothetical protein